MATYNDTVYGYGTPQSDGIVDVFGVRNVILAVPATASSTAD